ncbi:hypothetical protein D1B33_01590 [Lysinibacillus yapensis]|uniref:Uncharacterized protein n=1 Tax=Ureibacillus yapensis TaxID=2304605 RepID=A0A396SD89_9BACL|nr:hypothetical protein D1B33_01590 [Lysinibacillus yapensis]
MKSNRLEISRSYKMRLLSSGMKHNEMTFKTYLLEIQVTPCPESGILIYKEDLFYVICILLKMISMKRRKIKSLICKEYINFVVNFDEREGEFLKRTLMLSLCLS